MTPKEKAKELIDIYKKQVSMTIKDYSLVCKVLDIDMSKQCALIAVDEIIKLLVDLSDGEWTYIYEVEYYKKVKQEIKKI
jgi:hypothetical protein